MAFPGGTNGKDPTCRGRRRGFDPWVRKIPLEEGMVTHSSMLAWEIPWTEEPGELQSMGSQRVRHDQVPKHVQDCLCRRLGFEKEAFGG